LGRTTLRKDLNVLRFRHAALCALVPFLATAFALPSSAATGGRPWTVEEVPAVEFIDDVRISPDGAYALIDVGIGNVAKNTFDSDYRLVRLENGATTTLPAGLRQPRWSPSGARIAWLADSAAGTGIVLTDRRGGARRPLSSNGRSPVAFAWSPNGASIAAIETPAATSARAGRIHWMTAESDYRDTRPPKRDLWIIDVATGASRALTHDSWSYGGPVTDHDPSWSADGTELAVVRQPSSLYGDFEHAQYVALNVASGSARDLVGHPFFAYPRSMPPTFAPSGRSIAYAHTWDGLLPSREDIFIDGHDVTAGLDRDLWSCGAGNAVWQKDALVANLLDGVSMRLFRAADGAAPQALTPQDGSVEAFSTAAGGRIAYSWTTPTEPTELYVLDPGQTPRRVTHFGGLPGRAVVPTRVVEWTAPDGHVLHGQLAAPVGVDLGHVPLVVEPHGGPQCADDFEFDATAQYLATNGYAYFRPDPRGSDGYGDWSYKAIVGNWGPGPMADDLAGVDAVLAGGVSNRDQLYIEGGSYGGYLTTWIVTQDSRFKAAVAQVPVTNMLLGYTLSESPNIVRRFFGDKPALDQALLARESPITYAKDEHTPLLVMIGLRDTRAPYVQAIEFFKTVAENGTETRLFADDLAGHGPADPKGAILWLQATVAWLVQHGAPAIPGAVMPQ
jgi:dipeptidyl aminopeptidase/acylaminoacyl peptidase